MLQRIGASIAVVLVLVLHNDWWAREPVLEPVLGFIPYEIAYRLTWLILAALTLWWVLRLVWPEDSRR